MRIHKSNQYKLHSILCNKKGTSTQQGTSALKRAIDKITNEHKIIQIISKCLSVFLDTFITIRMIFKVFVLDAVTAEWINITATVTIKFLNENL